MKVTQKTLAVPMTAAMVSLTLSATSSAKEDSANEASMPPSVPPHRIYDGWESCRIGGGGFVQHIAFSKSDPNRLYLATDVGGCYRSDDGGCTWRMLHGAFPNAGGALYQVRDVCAHPYDPDTVLFAAGNGWYPLSGIWKSTDAGRSFRKTLDGAYWGNGASRIGGSVLVNAPDGSETVLTCAPGTGVFRSDDFGETWTPLGMDGVEPWALVPDYSDPLRLWLVAEPCKRKPGKDGTDRRGIFLTEDGGRTWSCVNGDAKLPLEMVQDPKDPSLLHGAFRDSPPLKFSRDGGRTWHAYANPEIHPKPTDQFHDGYCQALCTGPDFVLAGCSGGAIYRLEAGSDVWTKVNCAKVDFGDWYGPTCPGFNPFGASLGWIGVSPHDPRLWFFTDWYGLYASPDAGRSWNLSIDGIEMTVVHTLAQDPTRPERVHCGMADVGAFRSDDGGATFGHWQREILHDNIKCIAVCASDGNRVYAIGPRQWGWCPNCLNVSRDGGDTWTRPAMRGLPDISEEGGARMSTVAVRPENPDEIYVVVSGPCAPGGGGVYASGNAGEDFRWIGEGLPPVGLFADIIWSGGAEIACGRGGDLIAASSKTGRVFARSAGAAEWTEVTGLPAKSGSIVADAMRPGCFYAFGSELGVFRTDDGGITWRHKHDAPIYGVGVDLTKAGMLACNTGEGMEWSGDAGDTWRRIPGRPPRLGGRIAFAGNRILVSSGGSGVFRSQPIHFDEP